MTDPTTPLTDESEALLAEVHGTQMALTVFPARLRAIEQAAARRALEGSGVVEALESERDYADSVGEALLAMGHHNAAKHQSPNDYDAESGRACAILSCLLETVRDVNALVTRPEEPRVERCAFVWKSGTPCGKPKRDSRHKHDSSCLTGGEGHITDMLCHSFTPEAR